MISNAMPVAQCFSGQVEGGHAPPSSQYTDDIREQRGSWKRHLAERVVVRGHDAFVTRTPV
jgi:hypothetical protein